MTEYVVSYSKAHETAQVIGRFTSFDEAVDAARQWGAVGEGQKSGRDLVYDVGDHAGDDDYGIWIEVLLDPRTRLKMNLRYLRYLAVIAVLGSTPALAGSGLSGLAPLNGLNYGLMGQPAPQQPYYAPPVYIEPPQPLPYPNLGLVPQQHTTCYRFGNTVQCDTR